MDKRKALLIIDMPKCCMECDLLGNKHDGCIIEELPKLINYSNNEYILKDNNTAQNNCLKEIIKELSCNNIKGCSNNNIFDYNYFLNNKIKLSKNNIKKIYYNFIKNKDFRFLELECSTFIDNSKVFISLLFEKISNSFNKDYITYEINSSIDKEILPFYIDDLIIKCTDKNAINLLKKSSKELIKHSSDFFNIITSNKMNITLYSLPYNERK